jgi:hypothetical protein
MAGKLRGKHTTIIDSDVVNWLLRFGDVAPGFIQNRSSNHKRITIKQFPDKGWITVKILGEMAQELKYFHDDKFQYPWQEGNIQDSVSKSYTIIVDLPEEKR